MRPYNGYDDRPTRKFTPPPARPVFTSGYHIPDRAKLRLGVDITFADVKKIQRIIESGQAEQVRRGVFRMTFMGQSIEVVYHEGRIRTLWPSHEQEMKVACEARREQLRRSIRPT